MSKATAAINRIFRKRDVIFGGSAHQYHQYQCRRFTTPVDTSSSSYSGVPPDLGGVGGGEGTSMKTWQIHSYGGPGELQMSTKERIPILNGPEEVLVHVKAASVNPIDLAMTNGYGAETINILRDLCPSTSSSSGVLELPQKLASYLTAPITGRKSLIEFPLTLGRDFSGVVTRTGHGVKSDIRVGDEVYGVVGVQRQGSHAEYVVVAEDTIRRKPRNLTFIEAASIPYVGLTTWAALRITGSYSNLAQKRFLVLGGSGGIGTFAIQYLKSQGSTVITTCSTDAVPLLSTLGPPDCVIDYQEPDANQKIKNEGPYDCILHLSGPSTVQKSMELIKYLKPTSGQFITLSPPFLSNIDKHGLIGGAAKNLTDLIFSNIKSWNDAKAITKWAFFIPNGEPLKNFSELIESKEIEPVIQSVYKFDDLPTAYKKLEEGHLRGKIVVDMQN